MRINQANLLLEQNKYVISHFKQNPLKKLKKILIIGSNGLVGLNILSTLINLKKKFNLNISIYCVSKSSIPKNILKNISRKNINFLKLDITEKKINQKFDLIFFCAGYSSPSSFIKDKKTLFISSFGLNNAFHSLKKKGKLIFFSSSEIYNGLKKDFIETKSGNINSDNDRASYINGKKFGETLSHNKINDGYSVLVIRLSLAYGAGPGLSDKRVLNDFILKALKNKKISMLDRGQSVRKYIFIGDVMIYILKLLAKDKIGIYNICGKSKITILNLAKIISQNTNANLSFPHKNFPVPGAPKTVNISFKKLKKVYKFRLVSLSDGIKQTIKWYKLLLKK